jgi:hypothetical protein
MISTTETAILDRLHANLAAGTVLLGTFDPIDFTDDGSTPVLGQLRLERIGAGGSVGGSAAQYELVYSFSVYADVPRVTPAEKTAAFAMIEDAASAIVGWECQPMQYPVMLDGADTGYDGRVLRLSVGFSIPAIFAKN